MTLSRHQGASIPHSSHRLSWEKTPDRQQITSQTKTHRNQAQNQTTCTSMKLQPNKKAVVQSLFFFLFYVERCLKIISVFYVVALWRIFFEKNCFLMLFELLLKQFSHCSCIILFPHFQPSDADVMVGSAEDGGGEQKRERRHELHEITHWWSETAGVRTRTDISES